MFKAFKLLITFLLFSISMSVFAETTFNIRVDKAEVKIDDYIVLEVNVSTTSTGSVELLDIVWLENFSRLWQKTSNNISIRNGQRQSNYKLELNLKASKIGNYVLWPAEVRVWNTISKSNVINLDVLVKDYEQKQVEKKPERKKALDIKWIKDPDSLFKQFMYYQFLVLLLLIWAYLYYLKVNKNLKAKEKEIDLAKETKNKIKQWLKTLKKNQKEYNKSWFYKELNIYFREYFAFLWIDYDDSFTLKEIRNLEIDPSLMWLFEKCYLNEFSLNEDIEEERIELINELIKNIK